MVRTQATVFPETHHLAAVTSLPPAIEEVLVAEKRPIPTEKLLALLPSPRRHQRIPNARSHASAPQEGLPFVDTLHSSLCR
jgi:hypothetical protein